MKNKYFYFSIILYIMIIIQTTLLDYVKIYNIKPNLVLILIICITLIVGGIESAAFGLGAGLLVDILSGSSIGPHALAGFLVGFCLGGLNKRFYKDNISICVIVTFLVSIVYESIFNFTSASVKSIELLLYLIKSDILVEAVYNVILSVPIYILTLKITNKIESKEKRTNRY